MNPPRLVLDELRTALCSINREKEEKRGEGLIGKAENFLDNFKAASARLGGELGKGGGTSGAGIMDTVAKAGITKSAIMRMLLLSRYWGCIPWLD